MRTPEQTALIALRGLLEAKEMHIEKLQVIHSPAKLTCYQRSRESDTMCNLSCYEQTFMFRLKQREHRPALSSS
jgi:hypothetical protein